MGIDDKSEEKQHLTNEDNSFNKFIPMYDPSQNDNIILQNAPPGYFQNSNIDNNNNNNNNSSSNNNQYGMVYTQVPISLQQQQQPLQPQSLSYLNNQQQQQNLLNNEHSSQHYPLSDFQHQNIVPPIVFSSTFKQDPEHVTPSLVLFVAGFFFLIPWIVNIIYLKSRNRTARIFSIVSIILFSIYILAIVLLIIGATVDD